jgi:hypothetical protein
MLTDAQDTWLKRLEFLMIRFSHLGISADLASLSLFELIYLSRLLDS